MIGIIGGTGLGEALFGHAHAREHQMETPFGPPSSTIRVIEWHGLEVATLARHGPGHRLNPAQVPYRANIYALKALGVTHILASGAVGSLREHIHPRDLVIVEQLIDRTFRRVPTFYDDGLAVHVEFAEPFCRELRDVLLAAAEKLGWAGDANSRGATPIVHPRGTYVCMEGPAFSSVAESNLHRAWGGDVIGMTACPEAKLAREAEIGYALVALATDYDCWRPHPPEAGKRALLAEIIGHLQAATANAVTLMRSAVERLAEGALPRCACNDALELAIWSDRKNISAGTFERYGALLQRYAT